MGTNTTDYFYDYYNKLNRNNFKVFTISFSFDTDFYLTLKNSLILKKGIFKNIFLDIFIQE